MNEIFEIFKCSSDLVLDSSLIDRKMPLISLIAEITYKCEPIPRDAEQATTKAAYIRIWYWKPTPIKYAIGFVVSMGSLWYTINVT